MKIASQAMIFLLMIDAAWVAVGLAAKKNMWRWIVVYWIVLTLKNAADLFGGML